MRGYETFGVRGKYIYFPFGMSKTYAFVVTCLKDKNGAIKYDSKGNPVFGYLPIEIITIEGEDTLFYDPDYIKTLPSDIQDIVNAHYRKILGDLNDIRELKSLDKVNLEDINTYGKLRNVLSETFSIDVRSKIQEALRYNGINYDVQKMTFGEKINSLERPEYHIDKSGRELEIPRYPKYPIEELALIRHDDGTETAVFTMRKYDSWFINYTCRDDKKGPNFAKYTRKVLMDLFDIDDPGTNWRFADYRDKLLSSRFDGSAISLMKEYFKVIKKIAEDKNYKLDHYSGYLLLFMDMDIETDKCRAKIVGQLDPYLGSYGNTFIAAPGEVRPDIVASINYLAAEYKKMMNKYQRVGFGSKRKTGWSDNRKIALLTRASLISAMRMAILLQINPDEVRYRIEYTTKNSKNCIAVSLRDLYDATKDVLKTFYKNDGKIGNAKTLLDDEFAVELKGAKVTLGDIIASFVGIPVDEQGNAHMIALEDVFENPSIANELTDEQIDLVLGEVMGFAEPMKEVIREALDYELSRILEGNNKISFAHARFLAEFIGTNIGHHIIVEALKMYTLLRATEGLNPMIISSLYRNILTDGRYRVMIKVIDEKIKELNVAIKDAKKAGNKDLIKKHKELVSKCNRVKEALKAQLTLSKLKQRLEDLKAKRKSSGGDSIKLRFQILKAYSVYSIFKIKVALKELVTKENIKNGIGQAEILSIVAPVIFFATFDFMQLAFERNTETFANLMSDDRATMLLGVTLTILVLTIFNGIDERLGFGNSVGSEIETGKTRMLLSLLNPVVLTGTFLSSIGMFMRIFGAPFFQGKELVYKIGEIIGDYIGEEAEFVWNAVAGYELPLVEQTIFETAVNLALGGWRDAFMEILISSITAVINSMASKFFKPIFANLAYEVLMASEFL